MKKYIRELRILQYLIIFVLMIVAGTNVSASVMTEEDTSFLYEYDDEIEKKTFVDVSEEEWYYQNVYNAVLYGIMTGVGENHFEPEELTSRGQVVQTLYNIDGKPDISYESFFSDVEPEDWYAMAVSWAHQNKIAMGYENNTFEPNADVTREDIIVFLYRYAGKPAVYGNTLKTFSDYKKVSDYAKNALEWAIKEGLLVGDPSGTIRPLDTATRAELAAILVRFYEAILEDDNREEQIVPILMYHHIADIEGESSTIVSPEAFERQMKLLEEHDFSPISFEELIRFVEDGELLPNNPVIITFDDGYLSNYEYAFPVLQKHDFKATIFIIGSSFGQYEFYKDTAFKIIPHFGEKELKEMLETDLITIHSHSFDMHQWRPYESGSKIREDVLPLVNETIVEYTNALRQDMERQNALFEKHGIEKSQVFAYPRGQHSALVSNLLVSNGIKVTVTTDSTVINVVKTSRPKTLINLGRLNVGSSTTDEEILEYCTK